MFDTVHFKLENDVIDDFDMETDVNTYLQPLTGVIEHLKDNKEHYWSGYLENLKITLNIRRVTITGSLAKYYLSNNNHTLNRVETAKAIKRLSEELHLPIEKAKVTRIDVTENFVTDYTPEAYYNYLTETGHYNRYKQNESLYYKVKNGKTILFYDKVKKLKADGNTIPEEWEGKNVLRYELQLKGKQLQKLRQFREEITAKALTEKSFYTILQSKWLKEYESIGKQYSKNFSKMQITKPDDLFMLKLLDELGLQGVLNFIDQLQKEKAYKRPEYYSRQRQRVKRLYKKASIQEGNSLMAELDNKVRATKDLEMSKQ